MIHKRGALNHVPDMLSPDLEGREVASFSVTIDAWYAKRLAEVRARPGKFPQWRVDDDMLYKYKSNRLLDPVTNCEKCWRLVLPADHRERVLGTPTERRLRDTSVSRRRKIESRAITIGPECGMMCTTMCGAVKSVSTISLCNRHHKD